MYCKSLKRNLTLFDATVIPELCYLFVVAVAHFSFELVVVAETATTAKDHICSCGVGLVAIVDIYQFFTNYFYESTLNKEYITT